MRSVKDIQYLVYPDKEECNSIVQRFLENPIPYRIAYSSDVELDSILHELQCKDIDSKDVIVLKTFLGRFYQVCPGSPHMICCRYRVINTCFNCLYNCTYCYMHVYLNSYGIIQFTNTERLFNELNDFISNCSPSMVYRIGTGEFTDSLMFDEITGLGSELIRFFSQHQNIFFELKTKSSNVDHLLNIPYKGNAVIAWSLNTPHNINYYEHHTAALQERINAAIKAIDAGYYVAFHFDPIILYKDWEHDYYSVLQLLKKEIDPNKVVWISLGGFRYHLHFREILREKFPDEMMTVNEMFPGIDGKYRYYKPLRIYIYSFMYQQLREIFKKAYIYLCMETDYMWQEITGKNFTSSEDLEIDISNHLSYHFIKKNHILY
ncbi:MAG: DNA photolyase [Spirochaetes bacterium]|nr:DNA photolyase [Spirochaetota bacterium]